jgi:hypothetical protein
MKNRLYCSVLMILAVNVMLFPIAAHAQLFDNQPATVGGQKAITTAIEKTDQSIQGQKGIIEKLHEILTEMNSKLTGIHEYIKEIYTFLIKPIDAAQTDINWRYNAYQKVIDQLAEENEEAVLKDKLNNLILFGDYKTSANVNKENSDVINSNRKLAATRADAINNYSTHDVRSLLGDDGMYNNQGADNSASDKRGFQQKAAEEYIKNAGGGNIPLPPMTTDNDETPGEDTLKYIGYQNTAFAIQSAATNILLDMYRDRKPVTITGVKKDGETDPITISRARLLKAMNTGDSSSSEFWSKLDEDENMGILPRIYYFLNHFYSINFSLNDIMDKLDKMVLLQALTITQNNLISHLTYGEVLHGQAITAETPELKFEKK